MSDTVDSIENTTGARRRHSTIPNTGDNWVLSGLRPFFKEDGNLKITGGELITSESGTLYYADIQTRESIETASNGSQAVCYDIDSKSYTVGSVPTGPSLKVAVVDNDAQTVSQENLKRDESTATLDTGAKHKSDPVRK